jgi:sulfide:quinone oxidoreductase
VDVERVVALPLLRGHVIDGVPAEPDFGFIPVDRHGRVEGLDGVYAAGDATNYPVKQGGLAAQQADAVAEHVAARHGAPVEPSPFRPVLRGMLFTGGPAEYLRTDGEGEGAAATQALWWPPTKIAGRRLAPYLYAHEAAAPPGPAPAGFADLEVPLDLADAAPVRG